MTQELKASYVVAVAEQLSFVSTFLGGVSATILFSILIFSSDKRIAALVVAASALSACSLLVSVIASWRLIIGLHPDLPFTPDPGRINLLWNSLIAGYGIGVNSLLVSIGLSGWLRSQRSGYVTSVIAALAILFFMTTSIYTSTHPKPRKESQSYVPAVHNGNVRSLAGVIVGPPKAGPGAQECVESLQNG